MSGRVLRRILPACLLVASVLASGNAMAASVHDVAWDVAFVAQPTNLPLTAYHAGEPEDQYVLVLTNTGAEESHGMIKLKVTLPAGITVASTTTSSGWGCEANVTGAVLTCSYGGAIAALGHSTVLTIPVEVSEAGVRATQVAISGGGAPPVTVSRSTETGALPPSFGFVDFSNLTEARKQGTDLRHRCHRIETCCNDRGRRSHANRCCRSW